MIKSLFTDSKMQTFTSTTTKPILLPTLETNPFFRLKKKKNYNKILYFKKKKTDLKGYILQILITILMKMSI